jgi:hypothetical protein
MANDTGEGVITMNINIGDWIAVREQNWNACGIVIGTDIGDEYGDWYVLVDFHGEGPGRAPIRKDSLPKGWVHIPREWIEG